jgi:A/G-specific adenine glycosylase
VLARAVSGVEFPARSVTRAERDVAEALLPDDPPTAATWSVAVMELGALVCTADRPRCGACPVASLCAWNAAGRPAYDGPPRPVQTYAGTDRQCRGRLLAVLREAEGAVPEARLDAVWEDDEQRRRCLDSLLADRLAVRTAAGIALP